MSGKKPIIYLIDDHKSFTYSTKHVVNHYHHSLCEVFEFSSSKQALEELLSNPDKPDYIFLDLIMPELSGWELLQELETKIGPDNFKFEIIIISGSENTEDYKKAMAKEYVSHYIHKPIDLDKIKMIFDSDKYIRSFRRNKA